MAALFGNASADSRREPKSLLEFRAGKMKLNGTTVNADSRKGLVYMKLEDGLMHFCWKDRKTGEVVDDLIIFPGDAELKCVPQCTTGRVVLLKFKDTSRKFFYWLQEPKTDKDDDYLKKVNELIENPPNPAQAEAMTGGAGSHGGLPPGLLSGMPLQSLLGGNADPQLLQQLINSGALPPLPGMMPTFDALSGRGSSTHQPASSRAPTTSSSSTPQTHPASQSQPATSANSYRVQLGDLQNILSSMNIPTSSASPDTTAQKSEEEHIVLNDVITSEVLRPLSADSSVHEQLGPHLPPTSESVEDILTSPQFQQSLGVFGSALQSGQLGPLLSQFGMATSVVNAANTGNLHEFVSALQGEVGGESSEKDKTEDKDASNDDKGTA